MNMFDVEAELIERLDPGQLVRLLKQLLYLEAERHALPRSAPSVPLQISVPDGGEDGRIQWEHGPEMTDFVPRRFTIYQCKAQVISPAQCAKEVAPQNVIQPQLEEALDAGGAYILFCRQPYNAALIKSRVKKIREALKASGRRDWETACVDFYDGNRIASWVNCFLPAQVYVFECNRIALDPSIKTWWDWASHRDFQVRYVPNHRLSDLMQTIRDSCHKGSPQTLRITGLSGLGKTRLALEAFRPVEGSNVYQDNDLQQRVAYIDAASLENHKVVGLLNQVAQLGIHGLLVVDNCEPLLHRELVNHLGYKKAWERVSLMTLDFEPDQGSPEWHSIDLKASDCEGVVKGILTERFRGIGGPEIGRIEEFAQGFASIAVLIAEQITGGVEHFGQISDSEIINRLIVGRGLPDAPTTAVVTACSLFEHFEFSDETITDHVAFMAEHVAGVKPIDFFSSCTRIFARGILQRRGRFARVCPIPLAITLAARWLNEKPGDQLVELVGRLGEYGLFEQFCNQLTKLSFCKKANHLVASLIGPEGPFGSPEVLLTEEGSRLFRALVEVNSQTTTETLWHVLAGRSHDEMFNIKNDVRRNLVWSLTNLCWWPDTFSRAAGMMLSLAAAENETWGNNATGQFLNLFHVGLPGTEANLTVRLDVIKHALTSPDPEVHILAIRALGSALETHSFMRTYGPEAQGGRAPRRDYNPTWKEARTYWADCIALLVEEIIGGGPCTELAQSQLANQMRGLLGHDMLSEIRNAVRAIVAAKGRFWPEALVAIRNCLDYDLKDSPPGWHPQIIELEKMLVPDTIEERLRLIVSIPDWRHEESEDGTFIDIAAREAEKLAEELSSDTSWYNKLDVLLTGEQRQVHSFGKKLGQLAETPQLFIDTCLGRLRDISPEEAVPELVGAFLAGIKDTDVVENTIERIIADDKLIMFSVRITRCLDVTEARLQRLVPIIGNSRVPTYDFEALSYGRALDKISEDIVSGFCERLAASGLEGARSALRVLYMYCHNDESRFEKCHKTLRRLIMTNDLHATGRHQSMLSHDWQVITVKLLTGKASDPKLAKFAVRTVIDVARRDPDESSLSNHSAKTVLRVVLTKYFADCWPVVGKALLRTRPRFLLESLLGMGGEKDREPQDALLDALPLENIVQWCREKSPKGAASLAYIVPIFLTITDATWHPLARRLIDEFGQYPEVLDSLSANMCSFASGGSRAPYHDRRIRLLEQLLNHGEAKVRAWAEGEIGCYKKERERAVQRDEEWRWGIL